MAPTSMASASNRIRKPEPTQHVILSFSASFRLSPRNRKFHEHKHWQRQQFVLLSLDDCTGNIRKGSHFFEELGAHHVPGMGQLIPDLSKEVAHLADSSLKDGAAGAVAAGAVGAAAMGCVEGSRNKSRAGDIRRVKSSAAMGDGLLKGEGVLLDHNFRTTRYP